jgi:transcriptional regulator with XRE-family HTH domain
MGLHDLGVAVRTLRERTEPAAVGLPVGGRRVPGLRREELAELAGVSADYVRRLEQGRSHPSAGVVNAIARALRVGRAHESSAVFRHPDGGVVTLDGNMLAVPGDDLVAVVLTAAPGSADAMRLAEVVGGSGKPAVLKVGQPGPG